MKMKKAASVCTAALMAAAMLAGCTGGTSSKAASASSSADTASSAVSSASASAAAASSEDVKASSGTANSDGTYLVGVCQLVQHPALDAATKGFEDELKAEFGDKVKFDEQNAAGDASTATQICQNLVSENCDLILANATASLQSAAAATSTIPILGTSITEYGVALDISDFDGTVGGNISGTSDLAPLDQQAAMVSELFPDAKNVGIVYCSAEPNSKYQADKVQEYLEKAVFCCRRGMQQQRCSLYSDRQHGCFLHRGHQQCGSAGRCSDCLRRGRNHGGLRRGHAFH